ncbi:MAG: NADH:ubiquinone oxidoreductase subunit NDUFA12 [Hyphomicrobiaceae bacterium]|jgi:NADH:ubiquinone oxidoreductase subunit
MGIFSEVFAWWTGNTWGTRLTIWKQGRFVGSDELGNRYFEQKRGIGPQGKPRRWVVYKAQSEPTLIPPSWHGWMHYIHDVPPTMESYTARAWEKPHRPNMTGTSEAYRPSGSILAAAERPAATGDYKPWRPQ